MSSGDTRLLKIGILAVGAAAPQKANVVQVDAPNMELFGTEGAISTCVGDQLEIIRLDKDDWKTDVAGWQGMGILGLGTRWTKRSSTLLSLADAVLDGKPLTARAAWLTS